MGLYDPPTQSHPTVLLVWDAPNVDMGIGAILGARPTTAHRPRFDAVGHWLLDYTDQLQATKEPTTEKPLIPEAVVFTNVAAASTDVIRPWVDALRNVGFAVFAKPKTDDASDVDPDMLEHIQRRRCEGVLEAVIVVSADGKNFQPLLEELAADDVPVTVLGFQEHAAWAVAAEDLTFIDLEEIPGVFREPLPRVDLDNLPEGGAWLQPYRALARLRD